MFLTFTARFMYSTSKLALDRRPINIFLYFHRTVKAKRPNLALGQLQFKSCPSEKVFSGEFAGNISVGSDGSGTRKTGVLVVPWKIGVRQVEFSTSSTLKNHQIYQTYLAKKNEEKPCSTCLQINVA